MLISMCNNVYGIINIYNGHTTTYIANNIICCYLANCFNVLGRGYNGTMNITRSGKTCQCWSEQAPHQFILSSKQYPEIAGGHNYCRNPGSRAPKGPWCFTTDPNTRWEYCNVPKCGKIFNKTNTTSHNKGDVSSLASPL